MRKTVIVSRISLWQAKWHEAGGNGRCPDILRNPGTNWDRVAQNIRFWQEVVDNPLS